MRITEQPVTPAGARAVIPLLMFKVCEAWEPVGHRAIRGAKEGDVLNVIVRHSGTFKGRWRLVRITRHSETAEAAWYRHSDDLKQGGLAWLTVAMPFAYPMNPTVEQFQYEARRVASVRRTDKNTVSRASFEVPAGKDATARATGVEVPAAAAVSQGAKRH